MPQDEFTYNTLSYAPGSSCNLQIGRRNDGM